MATRTFCDGCSAIVEDPITAAAKIHGEKTREYDLCATCAGPFRRAIDPQHWPDFLEK